MASGLWAALVGEAFGALAAAFFAFSSSAARRVASSPPFTFEALGSGESNEGQHVHQR